MKPSNTSDNDHAWFVAVPKRQEFSAPPFHLGERVKWKETAEKPSPIATGRILCLTYQTDHWQYTIRRDCTGPSEGPLENYPSSLLRLVPDSSSIRAEITSPRSPWQMTAAAATYLGITAAQLRKLRRKGLFKAGHHYRDTSIPGSGKPRWQWHLDRCAHALAIPPEQRNQP